MNITENEKIVIETYKKDDFVSDYGWEHEDAATWVDTFHKDCKMTGKCFSGVMSSLVKKGIFWTNGESMGLTENGIEIAKNIKE